MKLLSYFYRHRRWLSPLTTLLTVLAMVGLLAIPYVYKLNQYEKAMDTLRPRIERMQGLVATSDVLTQRDQAFRQFLDRLAYAPDKTPEALQNEVSTRLRQSVDGSGLTLASLAAQSVKPQDGVDKFPFAISVQGSLSQLQVFLSALDQSPTLWIDGLTIRQGRITGDGAQNISAELVVVALRRSQI